MHSRPIINTRDEPHADPEKYRRLHVIVGDANLSEVSTYLKAGTTAIALAMLEDDFIDRDFGLDNPVLAFRQISRDLTCRIPVRLRDGRTASALDLQREVLELAQRYSQDIVSASWDSVLFDLKEGPLKKIFMLEPLRGTESLVRQLLDDSPTARDLLRNISRPTIV